ncbi:emerin isoform X2 [Stegastes partitus]|uniref:Emerin-like isoform X1 n=2 Tax=Stegastes partitus TaxID=144197 RepID=A0A9Y4ND22_9TELE|nr:PREDICTED: emerin-like isoform X1 [Stegastes partitus]XP_008294110.1 PREDICTED: emerin-like isoform X2 [Stegastes partitus]
MALSRKSSDEIRELLDEYGIKHGPVVDSTRGLYEKKLKEAMAKDKKAKPSPDKTYYREEEEEVTYLYRTPIRNEASGDSGTYMRSRPEWSARDYEHETSYSGYSSSKPEYSGRGFADATSYTSYSSSKPEYSGRDFTDAASYSGYSRSKPEYRGRDYVDEPYTYSSPSTYRTSYLKSTPTKSDQEAPKSPRLIPLWVQFVFFLVVAVFLYIVFSNMEANESFKGIQ